MLGFSVEQPASSEAGCNLKTKHSTANVGNVTGKMPSAGNQKSARNECARDAGQMAKSGWLSPAFWLLVVQWLFLSLREKSTE
jgi:hypothetical protein